MSQRRTFLNTVLIYLVNHISDKEYTSSIVVIYLKSAGLFVVEESSVILELGKIGIASDSISPSEFFKTPDGIAKNKGIETTMLITPTLRNGREKPPDVYNQAPIAGPFTNIREKIGRRVNFKDKVKNG